MTKTKLVLGSLLGALLVNIALACGSELGSFGPDGTAGAAGAAGASSSGMLDAALDAMLVPDAMAAPKVVVVANCDTFVGPSGGTGAWFAVAHFPGRTVVELANLGVIATLVTPPAGGPDGFTHMNAAPLWLRDGSAAALCGSGTEADPAITRDPVTFVLPATEG